MQSTGVSHGAGVGTGEDAEEDCGAIRLYGGDVTAKGGEYGAVECPYGGSVFFHLRLLD